MIRLLALFATASAQPSDVGVLISSKFSESEQAEIDSIKDVCANPEGDETVQKYCDQLYSENGLFNACEVGLSNSLVIDSDEDRSYEEFAACVLDAVRKTQVNIQYYSKA